MRTGFKVMDGVRYETTVEAGTHGAWTVTHEEVVYDGLLRRAKTNLIVTFWPERLGQETQFTEHTIDLYVANPKSSANRYFDDEDQEEVA